MFRRSLIKFAAAVVFATAAVPAFSAELGTQYQVLDNPLPVGQGTLVKIYSYDCPFCFRYDIGVDPKVLPRIEKEAGLKFMPMHLETKGQYGRAASEFLAMCMLRDQKAGLSIEDKASSFKKAKDAIYLAYHRKSERWTSGEAAFVKTMADATGISAEEFAKVRKSPEVTQLADSWKVTYPVAKIQGIPAYVVNGKYLIMTKSIQSLNGMVNLVKELAAMK
jgi:thiol:disulfide interchange protein DsbA